ncbi:hypothetical protein [Tenacibaculum sp. 190524A02b]|uniref:hypothetical protein n=1 Tax=Tenacibaculum vairaonense TaxID=3137860 RepID=UPI0031FAED61
MMTRKIINIAMIVLLTISLGCSNDEEVIEEAVVAETTAKKIIIGKNDFIDIRFVHEDGSEILDGECIAPNKTYGIAIELRLKRFPNWKTEPIFYTVNGVLYNMSFTQNDTKVNPIRLEFDTNQAQLVEQGRLVDTITVLNQGDFELVE